MSLHLFNTLTREKEPFEPIDEGKVRMYSCGQTIYDDLHIGNARAYVFWDTLRRYLEYSGYTVRHVQNITDVGHLTDDADQGEDKVEKRAKELGLEPMELVEDQIARYFEDTQALNIDRQDIVPRATGHINEMINYVQRIIEHGYAYERDGNIYFDVAAYSEDHDYGVMAKKDLAELKDEAESRVEPDEKKKHQYDFALWLNADGSGHLMQWDARFEIDGETVHSRGYPGWHLECSVMSQKYLGDAFDIHAGGKDHIFPHHPNERAQAFAASGEGQAKYWLHNEFITVEGEKMSKSKGNFYTVRELIDDGFSGDVVRLYLISSHYRTATDFSLDGLEKAQKELHRIRRTVHQIQAQDQIQSDPVDADHYTGSTTDMKTAFEDAMDDDLNTAVAKQALMEYVNDINRALDDDDRVVDPGVADILAEYFGILGIGLGSTTETTSAESAMADLLLEMRENAREAQDWETADRIRNELSALGFEVQDTDDGAIWLKTD